MTGTPRDCYDINLVLVSLVSLLPPLKNTPNTHKGKHSGVRSALTG